MGLHLLIADPRELVRKGLQTLFVTIEVVDTVDEIDTSKKLNQYLATHQRVDLVIVHQSLITTFTLLPDGHFVVLADKLDQGNLLTAFDKGAIGYLSENPWSQLLLITLQIAQEGGESAFLLDPAITPVLLDRARNNTNPSTSIDTLTTREQEVFLCLRRGLTDAEIARELCITQPTVRTHIGSILRKLQTTRRQIKYLPLPDSDA